MRFFGIACLALLIPATALGQSATSSTTRVAVVNSDEVLITSKAGKSLARKLEAFRNKKLKEIETAGMTLKKEEGVLKTQQNNLIRQRDLVSNEEFQRKIKAFEKDMVDFQKKAVNWEKSKIAAERELLRKKKDLEKPFLDKLLRIVNAVSQERGYDLVVDRAAVLYSQRDHDLTDEVVKRMNQK